MPVAHTERAKVIWQESCEGRAACLGALTLAGARGQMLTFLSALSLPWPLMYTDDLIQPEARETLDTDFLGKALLDLPVWSRQCTGGRQK